MIATLPHPWKCPECGQRDRLPNCPLCFECRDKALAEVMLERRSFVKDPDISEIVDERSER